MDDYTITKQDIIDRIYFITKLVQRHTGSTMQGALTSKSDSMGGIFDRFINTISDSLIFDKIIFKRPAFEKIGKTIEAVGDFYYYDPKDNCAGIAPDIFGIVVDGKIYPFVKFDNKWLPVEETPQIEVKTYKAKDQMVSLRNQNYEGKYLVLVDLNMRIDYLVPFLDKTCLNTTILEKLHMKDSIFIKKDDNGLIEKISPIDFSTDNIGTIKLISITTADDFMKQATLCGPKESIRRVKEIKELNRKKTYSQDKLSIYASINPQIPKLYKFNQQWNDKMNIPNNHKNLDFYATKIDQIEICKYNKNGIIIKAIEEGCSFNEVHLKPNVQYSVSFDTLNRDGNGGSEYFLQKQCACYLNNSEQNLINKIKSIITSD